MWSWGMGTRNVSILITGLADETTTNKVADWCSSLLTNDMHLYAGSLRSAREVQASAYIGFYVVCGSLHGLDTGLRMTSYLTFGD